jgi:ADP-ribosylglycohydrolase
VDAADFFARVIYRVLKGKNPVSAIEEVANLEPFEMSPISIWVSDGLNSRKEESISTIGRFGQACQTRQVFPGVVHLIAAYENNLEEALVQAVMAGGDSAARAIMTAMVLAAHLGMDAIPRHWVEEMNKRAEIETLLEKLG